jgi:hypothetical protein
MKKFLSLVLVLSMLAAMFTGLTLTAGAAVQMPDATAATTTAAADPVVLTVCTQAGQYASKTTAKTYTQSQLTALAQTKADGYAYEYYKESWQAVVATQYVTLDALLADAGVSFTSNSSLKFTCTDGEYTKFSPTYSDLSSGKYYFDGKTSTEVPAAIALTWGSGSLADGTVAEIAKTAKASGLRFVCGTTEADYTATKSAGKRMPSGVTVITVVTPASYADVSSSDWFYDAVDYASSLGYMQGTGSAFLPKGTTTRAMVAVIFWRMAGKPAPAAKSTFTDVPEGQWYSDAIAWAQANGIVTGANGKFDPNGSVTREQLAAIFYRYAQYKKYDTTEGGMSLREFPDYDATSAYARDALQWCVTMEILNGQSGKIAPQASALRCEFAAMLQRFAQKVAK